jgi:cytochrome c-type biogenesis protein CcmH/NrfG
MRSPLSLSHPVDQAPETGWQLAELYLRLGKFSQSLQLAYHLVQRDPNQNDRYLNHQNRAMRSAAEFAEEVGDTHRAAYYWQQVTQQQPQDAIAWHGLGLAKANLQDFHSAQSALVRSLQLEPNNQKARSQLVEIERLLIP